MGKDSIIELKIDTMAHGGEALGRHEGKVVFVRGAIPGEVVRARVVEERKRWSRAELLHVLDVSPHRVDPPCPYFGICGGCHWQHVDDEAQLAYKQQIVTDQLQRIGHLGSPPVRPAIGLAEPWFYRNHVQFAVHASGQLGFQAARSHEVVPVERCMLLHPYLDELHAALDLEWPELRRLSLRAGIHTGERMVVFETAEDQVPELEVDLAVSCVLRLSDGTDLSLIGRGAYEEALRGRRFRISAGSFFQVNTAQAEALLDVVQAYVEPSAGDLLLDLYCGVGTLGLSLRDQVGRVIGVEVHPAAVADARANAEGVDGAVFLEGEARTILPNLQERVSKAIVDPPRQGCRPEVIAALLHLAPSRLVYVSCDPTTLARNGASLADGGYELVEVQPIDMFPQTYHIETVSLWRRVE